MRLAVNATCASTNTESVSSKAQCSQLAKIIDRQYAKINIGAAEAVDMPADRAMEFPQGCWVRMAGEDLPPPIVLCAGFACNAPLIDRAEKDTTVCAGMPAECNIATCCDAAVKCDAHPCEAEFQDKANKASVLCGATAADCNNVLCCDATVRCTDFACTMPYVGKTGKDAIVCPGMPPVCDDLTCCTSNLKCDTHSCTTGFQDKADKADLACGLDCADDVCCDATVLCASFACTAPLTDEAGKDTLLCTGMPPVCDEVTCCAADVNCDAHSCTAGFQDKANKADIPCGTRVSDCTDNRCCVRETDVPQTSVPAPAPSPSSDTASTVASSVAASAGVLSGSVVGSTQGGRLKQFMKLARCPPDTDSQDMDFMDSPTGMGRGASVTQRTYMLYGNVLFLVSLVMLHFALTSVHYCIRRCCCSQKETACPVEQPRELLKEDLKQVHSPVLFTTGSTNTQAKEEYELKIIACDPMENSRNSRRDSRGSNSGNTAMSSSLQGGRGERVRPPSVSEAFPPKIPSPTPDVESRYSPVPDNLVIDDGGHTFSKSCAIMRFPSFSVFPFIVLFQPITTPAFTLLYYVHTAKGILAAAGGLFFLAGGVFWISRVLRPALFNSHCELVTTTGKKGKVWRWLLGVAQWSSMHLTRCNHYERKYSLIFKDFSQRCRWFMLVDLTTLFIISAVGAILPKKTAECAVQAVVMTVVEVLFFIAIVKLDPFLARLDHFHLLSVTGCQIVGIIFALATLLLDDSNSAKESTAMASRVFLLASTMLVLVKAIFDVAVFLKDRCMGEEEEEVPPSPVPYTSITSCRPGGSGTLGIGNNRAGDSKRTWSVGSLGSVTERTDPGRRGSRRDSSAKSTGNGSDSEKDDDDSEVSGKTEPASPILSTNAERSRPTMPGPLVPRRRDRSSTAASPKRASSDYGQPISPVLQGNRRQRRYTAAVLDDNTAKTSFASVSEVSETPLSPPRRRGVSVSSQSPSQQSGLMTHSSY